MNSFAIKKGSKNAKIIFSLCAFLVIYQSKHHIFDKMVHVQLLNWVRTAKLKKLSGGAERMLDEVILAKHGAFIFEGSFATLDGKVKFGR